MNPNDFRRVDATKLRDGEYIQHIDYADEEKDRAPQMLVLLAALFCVVMALIAWWL
jgi:hypothetical protein